VSAKSGEVHGFVTLRQFLSLGCQQWPNFPREEFVLIFVVKQIGSDRSEALEQRALRVKLR